MRISSSIIKGKVLLAVLLLCLCSSVAMAQQFRVDAFRSLPNDITAYISPVRDLNQEACALLKVVGDREFVFSTPLGVVKRQNEVGEIWLYVPRRTVLLTIKHPRWGVLRDYRFPMPLESRMTYELRLHSDVSAKEITMTPIRKKAVRLGVPVPYRELFPSFPAIRIKRPSEPLRYLALAQMGFYQGTPSYGVRLGAMRRHGGYLSVRTDFCSVPDMQKDCNREGVPADGSVVPYYTGRTKDGRWVIQAGGMHRLWGWLCLYEGIGYGKRSVGWETVEGEWLRNTAYSAEGFSAEVGGIYWMERLVLSAGVSTIATDYWEAVFGIGIRF